MRYTLGMENTTGMNLEQNQREVITEDVCFKTQIKRTPTLEDAAIKTDDYIIDQDLKFATINHKKPQAVKNEQLNH